MPVLAYILSQTIIVMQGQRDALEGARVQALHVVQQSTPLTQALQLLLDTGVSALPVVNEVRP